MVEHGHTVGELASDRQVVEGADDGQGPLGAEFGDELQDLQLVPEVQERRGFVQDEYRRVLDQGSGHHHPLSFAAGQRVHLAADEATQLQPVQYLQGLPAVPLRGREPQALIGGATQ